MITTLRRPVSRSVALLAIVAAVAAVLTIGPAAVLLAPVVAAQLGAFLP